MAAHNDWPRIRKDYVTDERISYRMLSEKYGIAVSSIYKRSRAEDWDAQREKYLQDRLTKTVDKMSDAEAENNACLQRVAGKMIQRIDDIISTLDSEIFMSSMKDISITIKNLRDVFDTPMSYRIKSAQLQQIEKQLDDNVQNVSEIIIKGADEDWTA